MTHDEIQALLDMGGSITIPPGVHMIDAVKRLSVRSNTNLTIEGTLKVIPNAEKGYFALQLVSVNNVTILGPGAIIGDRGEHLRPPGEEEQYGILIWICGGTDNYHISGLQLNEAWGDGISIDGASNGTVDNISCVNNGRCGMSIMNVHGLKITNSTFQGTRSQPPQPQAGIDIEPIVPEKALMDLTITGCRFINNKGVGLDRAWDDAPNRRRIYITNNQFEQHYRDGNGPPTGGKRTILANIFYGFRWLPGYDYWFWPKEYTID